MPSLRTVCFLIVLAASAAYASVAPPSGCKYEMKDNAGNVVGYIVFLEDNAWKKYSDENCENCVDQGTLAWSGTGGSCGGTWTSSQTGESGTIYGRADAPNSYRAFNPHELILTKT
ncbi:MAG: hypothetical protein ACYTGZ_03075 [Planctomycetota bacterium]|jgi:hypothetical protein